ncbi:hypothetical protein [Pseudoalteromonas piscicida]|uniref:hypothetical protein n=1 Tax=Pseudoalteromonas piscicida TaxID=43662 RepID=UPI001C97EFA3|nr:hypothetical protein [Pseudoalteromonas piscicida]QZO12014.1 hypothetical protein K5642_12940 [Pseudoalteromonas piscicida]
MFKKGLLVSALVLSSSAMANISVIVENDASGYDVKLTSKDAESSRYIPAPLTTLAGKSQDRFDVLSNYPSVVRIVDLEYQFTDSSIAPRCHFRLVVMKDYRSGKMVPQKVIAENEGGSYRDRAICSGKLNSFDLNNGDAAVTFSINRRKY